MPSALKPNAAKLHSSRDVRTVRTINEVVKLSFHMLNLPGSVMSWWHSCLQNFLELFAVTFERKTVNPFHAICSLNKGSTKDLESTRTDSAANLCDAAKLRNPVTAGLSFRSATWNCSWHHWRSLRHIFRHAKESCCSLQATLGTSTFSGPSFFPSWCARPLRRSWASAFNATSLKREKR
jgi:hypothetical protein